MAMVFFGIGTLPLVKALRLAEASEPQPALPAPVEVHADAEVPNDTRPGMADVDPAARRRREVREMPPATAARSCKLGGRTAPGAYADDFQITGKLPQCCAAMDMVKKHGPAYGIVMNESKSVAVAQAGDLATVDARLSHTGMRGALSGRNLGGVVGRRRRRKRSRSGRR